MTITIKDVIEQCARLVDDMVRMTDGAECADAIRALAAQYEGCIVAEGDAVAPDLLTPLYRARETQR